MSRLLLLIPLLLYAAACRNPLAVSDCPEEIEITVSAGTTPEIDWTPRCHLQGLYVWTPYGNATGWSIHGPPEYLICSDYGGGCNGQPLNTLYPPIRWGLVPEDAFQAFPHPGETVPPLRVGWPYVVHLSRANGSVGVGSWSAVDTFVVTAAP